MKANLGCEEGEVDGVRPSGGAYLMDGRIAAAMLTITPVTSKASMAS